MLLFVVLNYPSYLQGKAVFQGMSDQQSEEPMDQLPVPTVYMVGESLAAPEALATSKNIEVQRQSTEEVKAGDRLNHGNQTVNCADLNLYDPSSSATLPPASETTTKLHVTKSTKFKEANDRYIKLYRTRGRNRGMMVNFSYSEFQTGQEYREIDSDIKIVTDLFSDMNIRVLNYRNLSKEKTLETMKSLSPAGYESLFIVVSSHGYEQKGKWDTEFSCYNGGLISVYEVVDIFNNINYPELQGIPKVFIFQMCRGSKSLSAHCSATDSASFSAGCAPGARAASRQCANSDVLIAHSTLPGFVSVRNFGDAKGSLYMQALCKVFAAHAHECSVYDLFRLVDEAVKKLCPFATTAIETWGFGDLFLHPGLVENSDEESKEFEPSTQ